MTKILTKHFDEPKLHELKAYRRLGGYEALKKALGLERAQLLEEVKKSNLRGLGGAGFLTGLKWSMVAPENTVPGPRYVVVNADESEPGCFKDRILLTRAPHQLIEGLLLASYVIGAEDSFIFIRGEYQNQHDILQTAIAEAEKAGLIGGNILGSRFNCRVFLMRGAGAYISGLDTALLETMEGKKAWPRQPPPFPTVSGLMGQPTVVNNVETLMMLPFIVNEGGTAFAKIGVPGSGGTVVFSISGHVERPGLYEFPMGIKLRDVLAACGGVRGARKLKGVIPGGTSMLPLLPQHLDLALDFDSIRAAGTFLGAGGMIILDETADAVSVAHDIERFLAHESCGQCTPCREGASWSQRILERLLEGKGEAQDIANLARIGENITGKVICALGDTVGMVLKGYIDRYPDDFNKRVNADG